MGSIVGDVESQWHGRKGRVSKCLFGETSFRRYERLFGIATALRKTIAQAPAHKMETPQAHLVKVDGLTIRNPLLEIRLCSCPETSPLHLLIQIGLTMEGRPQPSETFQRCYGSVSQTARLRQS